MLYNSYPLIPAAFFAATAFIDYAPLLWFAIAPNAGANDCYESAYVRFITLRTWLTVASIFGLGVKVSILLLRTRLCREYYASRCVVLFALLRVPWFALGTMLILTRPLLQTGCMVWLVSVVALVFQYAYIRTTRFHFWPFNQ